MMLFGLSCRSISKANSRMLIRVSKSESELSSSFIDTVHDFDSRVDAADQARISQSEDIAQLMGYLEKAFAGIDELGGRIDAIRDDRDTRGDDVTARE